MTKVRNKAVICICLDVIIVIKVFTAAFLKAEDMVVINRGPHFEEGLTPNGGYECRALALGPRISLPHDVSRV